MNTLLFVVGTRPETIKIAPIVRAAPAHGFRPVLVHTGQHRDPEMSTSLFAELGLPEPEAWLDASIGTSLQKLGRMLASLEPVLRELRPDGLVAQGDTDSALAGSIAANRCGVPLFHVEAGLRSYDRRMPEEHNRIAADRLADLLFAPTPLQASILLGEGMPCDRVHVVGNTVADAVRATLDNRTDDDPILLRHDLAACRYAILTLHRQENVDNPAVLAEILAGVGRAADTEQLRVLFLAHPRTRENITRHGVRLPDAIRVLDPVGYAESLVLQRNAEVVLTDSGGLQEEAAILGVPCATLRTSTERPETIDLGANVLAGVDGGGIVAAVGRALRVPRTWEHPYGAGDSARRILEATRAFLDRRAAAAPAVPEVPASEDLPSDADRSGRTLGAEELEQVARVLRSGTLNSTRGVLVHRFQDEFAARLGRAHGIACASGSAAVHCAVASIGLRAGDEVITTPITDMGAITPILYQGGVPVFADVDATTLNVTAKSLATQITERTRALIVTHLFGMPCDMDPILELAACHDLVVIEDAAQAFGAVHPRGTVGTFGHLACFSLQQGKHVTTGEGGVVVTDDPRLARAVFLFVNKAWGYGDEEPDHYFPALNYRMTELQGAVGLAQLDKLPWIVQRRREVAAELTERLRDVDGLLLPADPPNGRHGWWKYPLFVDPGVIDGGAVELGRRLRARGIACAPRYIGKPAFECALFRDWRSSPVTALPLSANPRSTQEQPLFHRDDYPGAVRGLERVVVLPINEMYTETHVDAVAEGIRAEARRLASRVV